MPADPYAEFADASDPYAEFADANPAPASQESDLKPVGVTAKRVSVPNAPMSDDEKAALYGSEAGPGYLLTNPDFLRGLARGAIGTYTSGTTTQLPENAARHAQELENAWGVGGGRGTGEGIAGEMLGGFLAPTAVGMADTGPAANLIAGRPAPSKFDTSTPLGAAAQAASDRIQQLRVWAEQHGIVIPKSNDPAKMANAAAKNQPISDELIRQDMRLPSGAQIEKSVLDPAADENVGPAYQAMKSYPGTIPHSPEFKATWNDVEDLLPRSTTKAFPIERDLTGEEATKWYRAFTDKANKYASMQGTTAAGETYDTISGAYRDLANTLYDSVDNHLTAQGLPDMASDWREAAKYYAKNRAVLNATEGGHVNIAGPIKQAFVKSERGRGPPLEGNTAMLAELATYYPQAFRRVPGLENQAGPLMKAARLAVPFGVSAAGAAAGRSMGVPGLGAMAGRILGDQTEEAMK